MNQNKQNTLQDPPVPSTQGYTRFCLLQSAYTWPNSVHRHWKPGESQNKKIKNHCVGVLSIIHANTKVRREVFGLPSPCQVQSTPQHLTLLD